MSCDIIIPWSGNCEYRLSARSYVESRWRSAGFPVIVGEMEGPWSKARAVAAALERSTADVIVVTDADVWTDAGPDVAVTVAESDLQWAVPAAMVHRLDAPSTRKVIDGGPLGGRLVKPAFRMVPGGGILVLERELYDRAPLDPRFVGWGHEDEAWGMALANFAGRPAFFGRELWHLWHPPQNRYPRTPERLENKRLRQRYAKARRNRDEMCRLTSEAQQLLGW